MRYLHKFEGDVCVIWNTVNLCILKKTVKNRYFLMDLIIEKILLNNNREE
jgi:hypothetical protein